MSSQMCTGYLSSEQTQSMGNAIRHIFRRKVSKVNEDNISGRMSLKARLSPESVDATESLRLTLERFSEEHICNHPFEYDLIVIGGGSGGLACAKEAGLLGAKVALFDFIKPTPIGTTWGLGGTCVNVGCIPKKLMHTASLLGESIHDSQSYGWKTENEHFYGHSWDVMKSAVQDYIGSLNWGYRMSLRDNSVDYINAYATFLDCHTVEGIDKRKKKRVLTSNNILIATGLRPKYPDIPGAKEFGITSDDLFSLDHNPGKTLFVGASYVSLECAGFLHGIGNNVTVLVRSILLRGFDQQMAERIGEHMSNTGINFIRPAIPTKVELVKEGKPGLYKVTFKYLEGEMKEREISDEFNTVVWALGREPVYDDINYKSIGLKLNSKNKKIPVNSIEQTNIPNVYAVGDVIDGNLELTPVAIQAGKLLAQRLFGDSKEKMDYDNVPTTVFTPLEYGACGLSEETAIARHGIENIEVYHSLVAPLEWSIPHRCTGVDPCYLKVICLKSQNEKIIGFHFLGPQAGEVTQGIAVAMKAGATKKHLDNCIGIHPTNAEVMTVLDTTKWSGKALTRSSC